VAAHHRVVDVIEAFWRENDMTNLSKEQLRETVLAAFGGNAELSRSLEKIIHDAKFGVVQDTYDQNVKDEKEFTSDQNVTAWTV